MFWLIFTPKISLKLKIDSLNLYLGDSLYFLVASGPPKIVGPEQICIPSAAVLPGLMLFTKLDKCLVHFQGLNLRQEEEIGLCIKINSCGITKTKEVLIFRADKNVRLFMVKNILLLSLL